MSFHESDDNDECQSEPLLAPPDGDIDAGRDMSHIDNKFEENSGSKC